MTDFRMTHVRVYDDLDVRVAHLIAVTADVTDAAACGISPKPDDGIEGFWSGTGGTDEWHQAQVLPLCKRCREATA